MPYDLNALNALCGKIGLAARITDHRALEIDLGDGAILEFQNDDREGDCLLGFLDASWHTHGNYLIFTGPHGGYLEVSLFELLFGISTGAILVCERWASGRLADRWLTHSGCNDEFQDLRSDETILVRRARTSA